MAMAAASADRGGVLTDKEAIDLVRAYYSIPDNQRRKLFDLALVLGEAKQIAHGEDRPGPPGGPSVAP